MDKFCDQSHLCYLSLKMFVSKLLCRCQTLLSIYLVEFHLIKLCFCVFGNSAKNLSHGFFFFISTVHGSPVRITCVSFRLCVKTLAPLLSVALIFNSFTDRSLLLRCD